MAIVGVVPWATHAFSALALGRTVSRFQRSNAARTAKRQPVHGVHRVHRVHRNAWCLSGDRRLNGAGGGRSKIVDAVTGDTLGPAFCRGLVCFALSALLPLRGGEMPRRQNAVWYKQKTLG